MSPALGWNHSKRDIWEQNLQSVVNGEKLTSTASTKLYWTQISEYEVAWTKVNIQKSYWLSLTLLSQKTLPFFISYWVGAWIRNFHLVTKQTHKKYFFEVPYVIERVGWLVDLDWVRSFALNLTNEKRSGNLPSFPSFFLKERKNKQSWKAGHAFAAKYKFGLT